jgi:hypothetical protein
MLVIKIYIEILKHAGAWDGKKRAAPDQPVMSKKITLDV